LGEYRGKGQETGEGISFGKVHKKGGTGGEQKLGLKEGRAGTLV